MGATVALIPVQTEMVAEDIAARLVQSKAKLLVTNAALLSMAEVASVLAGIVPIISMDKADPHTLCLDEFLKHGDPAVSTFELTSVEDTACMPAFINRTSGSTGKMKSVMTTHAHYIATMEGTLHTVPDDVDSSGDTWLSTLSLGFFINAKLLMSLNILLGIPVFLMRQPLNEYSSEIIKRQGVSFLFVTPPVAASLAKSSLSPEDTSSVKWLLSAGAPMSENLRSGLCAKFPAANLTLEWATSETMLITMQYGPASKRPGSSGTLVHGMQARVIDTETGADLGANQLGELLVRNKLARFQGYKDDAVANRAFDSEGFFHTDDYGYIDEHYNVYIIDRLKEMLRVGSGYGSRVSATELENVLYEHPAVASVVVVGVHSEELAVDLPTAFIKLQETHKDAYVLDLLKEIEDYGRRHLKGLKSLTGGAYFVDQYPTTGFKVNRQALKRAAKKNLKNQADHMSTRTLNFTINAY